MLIETHVLCNAVSNAMEKFAPKYDRSYEVIETIALI